MYLLLCILTNAYLVLTFRAFGNRGWPILPIVALNYWVCFALSFTLLPVGGLARLTTPDSWWLLAGVEGLCFIGTFTLVGLSAARLGAGYTGLLAKLSLVIPVTVSLFAFNEQLDGIQLLGLGLSLAAIVVLHWHLLFPDRDTSQPPSAPKPQGAWALLPVFLFLGAGAVDTNFKLFDAWYADNLPQEAFMSAVFAVAGTLGVALAVVNRSPAWRWRPILIGTFVLGVPNFFSLWFLLKALAELPGSLFYPLNNLGQLLLMVAGGALLYREPLYRNTWAGLGLALLSLVLLNYQALLGGL
jgi:multidrug transporter EmrE-like cation transporter